MAIDTANKRRSAGRLLLMVGVVLPVADSGIDAADRYHALGVYSGMGISTLPLALRLLDKSCPAYDFTERSIPAYSFTASSGGENP